jgi:hypothetical protein
MWRREEKLGYWLTAPPTAQKPDLATKFGRILFRKTGLGNISAAISEQGLSIDANAIGLEVEFDTTAGIKDGLSALGSSSDRLAGFKCEIRHSELLGAVVVRNMTLPNERRARIRQAPVAILTNLRSTNPVFPAPVVRTPECVLITLPGVGAKGADLSAIVGNRIMFSQLLDLPYVRSSIDVNLLPAADYESFLREAEILKGLPANVCELLAVFRNVPIEHISNLSYLADRNIIVYRISAESHRTRTRVHDMAAVLNTASREIHLVPHRARYRSAILN